MHKREFGFNLESRVLIDNVRVQSIGKSHIEEIIKIKSDTEMQEIYKDRILWESTTYFEVDGKVQPIETPVFDLESLGYGFTIEGPAIILNKTGTIIIEPGCNGTIADDGSVIIDIIASADKKMEEFKSIDDVPLDPIELSIFGHRFMSIAEQMGTTLSKTAVSTNIKERLDFFHEQYLDLKEI